MACPKCQSVTGSNDAFCAKCGSQLEIGAQHSELIEDTENDQVISTCDRCGAGLTEGQLYCSACGKAAFDEESD